MEKKCEYCGTSFDAARKDKRYCSKLCRTYAHRSREGQIVGAKQGRPVKPLEVPKDINTASSIIAQIRKNASALKQSSRGFEPTLACLCNEISAGIEKLLTERGL